MFSPRLTESDSDQLAQPAVVVTVGVKKLAQKCKWKSFFARNLFFWRGVGMIDWAVILESCLFFWEHSKRKHSKLRMNVSHSREIAWKSQKIIFVLLIPWDFPAQSAFRMSAFKKIADIVIAVFPKRFFFVRCRESPERVFLHIEIRAIAIISNLHLSRVERNG